MDTDRILPAAPQAAQAAQPDTRANERGFVARRRRLRNRWNVQMRKDHRAQDRSLRRETPAAGEPADTPVV